MPSKSNKKMNSSQASKKTMKNSQINGKRAREPSEEPTYIVEAILDKKKSHGVWTYKVKWQGYTEDECTWEPVKHLETVKNMVDEFNKKLKHKDTKDDEKDNHEEKKATENKKTRGNKSKPIKEEDVSEEQDNKEGKKSTSKKSPYKKVKTDELQGGTDSVKKTSYGHFQLGDKPRRIVTAKKEKDELIFTIEWEPHESGKLPLNTEMTSLELRKYDKDLLLDFYEDRLKFVKPGPKDSMKKSAVKSRQEEESTGQANQKMEEEISTEKNQNYEVVNSDGENAPAKGVPTKKKPSDIINLEDSPQGLQDDEGAEEVKEAEKNNAPTQVVPTLENTDETRQDVFKMENIIDNKGQAIFADLGTNTADDIKELALDPHYRVVSQPIQPLAKPENEDKGNVQEAENKPEQDLQLESPKEISDNGDVGEVGGEESSGVENI